VGPKVAASDSFPSCRPLVWDTQMKENRNLGQKVTRDKWPQEAASESPKTELLSFNLLKPRFLPEHSFPRGHGQDQPFSTTIGPSLLELE